MTQNYILTKTLDKKHRTFGGRIYPSDFDRKTTLSEIADKILRDKRFDNYCKNEAERRNNFE